MTEIGSWTDAGISTTCPLFRSYRTTLIAPDDVDDRHPELVDRNEKAMVDARKHFYETGYLNGHVRF